MKTTLKLSVIAAALTTLGATALADSTEMSRQIDIGLRESGRPAAELHRNTPTIGVYAHGRGIAREQRVMREPQSELRLQQRDNFHGQTTSIYRPAE